MSRRLVPSPASTTNRARCCSGSHSSTDGGRRNPVWRSIVRKLFIGTTFAAMENHRPDSIPNDSYPVKSDRLLGLLHINRAPAAGADWAGPSLRLQLSLIVIRHHSAASVVLRVGRLLLFGLGLSRCHRGADGNAEHGEREAHLRSSGRLSASLGHYFAR